MTLTCELFSTDLVERNGRQLAQLNIENTGEPRVVTARYRIAQRSVSKRWKVPHGCSTHWIAFPAVAEPTSLLVALEKKVLRTRVRPARTWAIHLVNHTHTDLGYTDYQPNIDRAFYHFLLEAMTLVEQTKRFPEPARFRWTNEASYHLRNFLRFATREQVRELVAHMRRGVIDTSACYFHTTDLPNADQVIRSFQFARDFTRRHRVPLRVGMTCDINGLPWVFPAALHDLGVHNLSMAINADSARSPLKRAMPFWWESPDGKRILVWNGEVYLLGNDFDLDKSVEQGMVGVSSYLRELGGRGYPYEHVLLLMSGARADTAPPTIAPCLITRDWNQRFANPTLRLDTLSDWFTQVRKMMDSDVPVYRGHWPDYWAHGLGSAIDEIRFARETQHLLSAAGVAASYVGTTDRSWTFPTGPLDHAYDEAELSNEHTFGAFCSVREPYRDFSRAQWQYKRDHFYRARLESELALHSALEQLGRSVFPEAPSVVVHNSLAWSRDGIAELAGVSRPLPGYAVERLVDAESGRVVPYWRKSPDRNWAELGIPLRNVPATGHRVLRVAKGASPKLIEWQSVAGPQNVLENRYYRVRVNRRTGQIDSIFDKQLRRELVRANKALPFGRIVQEQLSEPEVRLWAGREDQRDRLIPSCFKRSWAKAGRCARTELPGCYQQLEFDGTCSGLTGVNTTIRLHEREKRIDVVLRVGIPERPDPQAAYVAFPFAGARPRTWLEVPGAAMEPGPDQIPTTCYDFYTVQNFVRLETGRTAVTLVPRDTPLVQLNEISTFRFREKLPRPNGVIVAWLFNNYWHTNFPASQPGEHTFRFSLTSGTARSHRMADSYRFAYEVANPLRAHFLPESPAHRRGRAAPRPASGSFVSIEPENVLLLSVRPATDGGGYVFRLQETAGERTRAVLRFAELKPRRAFLTDLYEGNPRKTAVAGRNVRVTIAPRGLATVKVQFYGARR